MSGYVWAVMGKSAKDIIAELRVHASLLGPGAACNTLRDAADRLEKASMVSAFDFSRKHVMAADLKWKVGFRAGVEALRDAIADGSIDETGK